MVLLMRKLLCLEKELSNLELLIFGRVTVDGKQSRLSLIRKLEKENFLKEEIENSIERLIKLDYLKEN